MVGKRKVLVIGLDGATFDLLLPLLSKGKLPVFERLLKNGVRGNLLSTIPILSPSAWSSFMTGKNPGKHGLLDFVGRDENSYRMTVLNATHRASKEIWSTLSEHDKRSIVINVPFTYPAKRINGTIITGMMTPRGADDFIYPSALREEINKVVGEYRIHPDHAYEPGRIEAFVKDLFDVLETRARTASYLLSNRSWDFFMVVFTCTDQIQHGLWMYLDPDSPEYDMSIGRRIFDCYERLDNIIGRILEAIDENTVVIVMSDHGAGPLYKHFHINAWLMKLGFLRLRRTFSTLIKRFMYEIGVTPLGLYSFLVRLRLGSLRVRLGREKRRSLLSKTFISLTDVDWRKTKAYAFGRAGGVYINLKDREPVGIVNRGAEYENLREAIINSLIDFKDPKDGKHVVEKAYRKEEIYSGPLLEKMPDIVLTPARGYVAFGEYDFATNRTLTQAKGISSRHEMEGILIMTGPMFKKDAKLPTEANMVDLAPTILYLLGVPISTNMDGSILKDAFISSYLESNTAEYTKEDQVGASKPRYAFSKEDEEKVKERLRELGYL